MLAQIFRKVVTLHGDKTICWQPAVCGTYGACGGTGGMETKDVDKGGWVRCRGEGRLVIMLFSTMKRQGR
jgi:hypothetical protein